MRKSGIQYHDFTLKSTECLQKYLKIFEIFGHFNDKLSSTNPLNKSQI